MAQTNITTEQQQIELREIKRNSSKQIVSYTLEEDSQKEYGYHKVKGNTTLYDRDIYNRTVETLSNELINPVPDFNEVISLDYITEDNMYRQAGQRLVPIRQPDDIPEEDVFSGLYEMTDGGPWKRRQPTASGNTHYFPIEQGYTSEQRDYQGDVMGGDGFRPVPWDKGVRGPQLESNGGYRITKELVDSGRNLKLIASFGVANQKPETHTFKFKFTRERIVPTGRKIRDNFVNDPTNPNQFIEVIEFSVPSQDYPFLTFELDIGDLKEDDLWYVQAAASATNPIYWYGDKSYFEVIAYTEETPPITIPFNTTGGASITNGFVPNQEAESVAGGAREN